MGYGQTLGIQSSQRPFRAMGQTLGLLQRLKTAPSRGLREEARWAHPEDGQQHHTGILTHRRALTVVFKDELCKHDILQPQKCPCHGITY